MCLLSDPTILLLVIFVHFSISKTSNIQGYQINEATVFITAKDWKHLKCPLMEIDLKKIIMYPIVYLLDGILCSCENIEWGNYTLIWEDTQVENKKSGQHDTICLKRGSHTHTYYQHRISIKYIRNQEDGYLNCCLWGWSQVREIFHCILLNLLEFELRECTTEFIN